MKNILVLNIVMILSFSKFKINKQTEGPRKATELNTTKTENKTREHDNYTREGKNNN